MATYNLSGPGNAQNVNVSVPDPNQLFLLDVGEGAKQLNYIQNGVIHQLGYVPPADFKGQTLGAYQNTVTNDALNHLGIDPSSLKTINGADYQQWLSSQIKSGAIQGQYVNNAASGGQSLYQANTQNYTDPNQFYSLFGGQAPSVFNPSPAQYSNNPTAAQGFAAGGGGIYPGSPGSNPLAGQQIASTAPPTNASANGSYSIPFKTGLTPDQQQGITQLSQKPQEQWTSTDFANWNYATNNAPRPGVTGATGGTTPTQASQYAGASGYTGSSIVDFLRAAGKPTDLASRTALASQYGISGYQGTAAQNTQLLNILKGYATGNVSETGIPNTMGSPGTVPTPGSPINAGALSTQGFDLGKFLGAGSVNTGLSDLAGILAMYAQVTDDDKKVQEFQQQYIAAQESLGMEAADLQAAMDAQGVGAAFQQVKALNLQAAQLQGQLAQFDVESQQQQVDLSGQPIPQGLVTGQQAQLRSQRDLTRLSKTAELTGILALSQAYQGNAELGMKLAQQAVDMKYAPIKNKLDTLKTQIGFAQDNADKKDAARFKILDTLLNISLKELDQQKSDQKDIQSLAVQAAVNGAPLSVTDAMKNSKDIVSAANLGGKWIKGNLEKLSSNSSNSSTKDLFTQTQTNNGAANAGIPIAEFESLSNDEKNWYINNYSSFESALGEVDSVEKGQELINMINANTVFSQETKSNLIEQIQSRMPEESSGNGYGSFLGSSISKIPSSIGGAISGVWNWLTKSK